MFCGDSIMPLANDHQQPNNSSRRNRRSASGVNREENGTPLRAAPLTTARGICANGTNAAIIIAVPAVAITA